MNIIYKKMSYRTYMYALPKTKIIQEDGSQKSL